MIDERPITAFAPFEHSPDAATLTPDVESHLPRDPRLPTGVDLDRTERAAAPLDPDPITGMIGSVALLSDAVLSPEGLLHRLFADIEAKAAARHEETLRSLTHFRQALCDVAENQIETLARINKLEPAVEEHERDLRLVRAASNGNGHDHVANGHTE